MSLQTMAAKPRIFQLIDEMKSENLSRTGKHEECPKFIFNKVEQILEKFQPPENFDESNPDDIRKAIDDFVDETRTFLSEYNSKWIIFSHIIPRDLPEVALSSNCQYKLMILSANHTSVIEIAEV